MCKIAHFHSQIDIIRMPFVTFYDSAGCDTGCKMSYILRLTYDVIYITVFNIILYLIFDFRSDILQYKGGDVLIIYSDAYAYRRRLNQVFSCRV
mgnify:CR=1 FL=1